MKISSALIISMLLWSACEKEDLAPKLRRETAEKIMGKWMVQRTINEVYDPRPGAGGITETAGTADDYLDFKTSELVEIKSSQASLKVESYTVWNPSQVMIGAVSWWIDKLTASELVLIWDRNDASTYTRSVTRIYLTR